MVWDGKRSPIKFLIIISPAESRVVAEGLGQGGWLWGRGCDSVCMWEAGIWLVGERSGGIWCFN